MNIFNEPVKVMAIFNKDGKIAPVKFRLENQVIKIEKILKDYEEKTVWGNSLFFECLHNCKDVFILKYVINKNLWYLNKK